MKHIGSVSWGVQGNQDSDRWWCRSSAINLPDGGLCCILDTTPHLFAVLCVAILIALVIQMVMRDVR